MSIKFLVWSSRRKNRGLLLWLQHRAADRVIKRASANRARDTAAALVDSATARYAEIKEEKDGGVG